MVHSLEGASAAAAVGSARRFPDHPKFLLTVAVACDRPGASDTFRAAVAILILCSWLARVMVPVLWQSRSRARPSTS